MLSDSVMAEDVRAMEGLLGISLEATRLGRLERLRLLAVKVS